MSGKNALPEIHSEFPGLAIYQSEQECGDGENAWTYTSYCWQLMKHYFRDGISAYMYWNISTDKSGKSAWGWAQNALVSVDTGAMTYRFNHDHCLLKHLTHFVDVGAKVSEVTGTCDNALAFVNPGGAVVLLMRNELARPQLVQIQVQNRAVAVQLPADSVGTELVKAA